MRIYAGYYISMMSLGVPVNHTATAETPHLDKTFRCLTFYYHMFGDEGMGRLVVSADLNSNYQELWSQTGLRQTIIIITISVRRRSHLRCCCSRRRCFSRRRSQQNYLRLWS